MRPARLQCPRCRSQGGDTAGDNLHVYPPGKGAFCHACRYYVPEKDLQALLQGDTPMPPNPRSTEDTAAELDLIQTFPFGAPHKPALPTWLCQRSGVRYSVDDSGRPDKVYYPYYAGKELVDAKRRGLPKQFSVVTGQIKRAELFGQHLIPPDRRGLLVIVEGEDDKIAAEALFNAQGKAYSVVSLPSGANEQGNIDKAVRRQIEFVAGFRKVALCLDQDEPGQATAQALAELLAPSVEVRLMRLPAGFKDAYDMLAAERYNEWMEALTGAERYSPEGIIEGPTITLEQLQKPMAPGFELPYPELQRRLHGLRKAEITLIPAGTGAGKTTFCRELGYHLMREHGLTIGNIYLEEQWTKTANGYIAIDNDIPLPLLRTHPELLTQQQWQASFDRFYASGKSHFFRHFGSVASDVLLSKMRYMALGLGCDFIFLDHVTMVLSGEYTQNERKDIDMLMTRLAELVTETGVGIIPVVHLKRSDGKDFNRGEEVSLTDLRGSSQLEALSWNVIALERDMQGNNPDVSKLRLLKNREWGPTGVCDRLVYNHQTGRQKAVDKL